MRFVQEHREEFGVAQLCRVLGMAVSTLRPPGAAGVAACCRGCGTGREIEKIWADSGRSYGSPRVHARQARDGIRVGRKRVERIMADNGWQGAYLRRGWKITTQPGESRRPRYRIWWAATSPRSGPTSCGSPKSPMCAPWSGCRPCPGTVATCSTY